jgi:polysaccharide deacetylase 2 family uncharacterized protein YibQ
VVIRGFLAGLISGGLLAAVLAAVASLSVPLPPVAPPSGDAPVIAARDTAAPGETVLPPVVADPAAPQTGAAPVAAAVPPVAAAAPAAPALPGPQPGAAADPAGPAPVAPAPGPEAQAVAPAAAPAADPAPAPVAGPVAPGDLALLAPAPVPAPEGSAAAPQAPGTGDAPPAQAAPGVVPAPAAPADVPLVGSTAPAVPAPETPAPEAATPEPEPAPQPEARPADPAPEPDPAQAATTPGNPVPALPGRPQTGLGASVDGVRTGRLPRIGDAAAEAPPPAPEAAPDAGADAAAIPEDAPALQRNARAFANPDGKPPMAILLLDDPASGVDLAALAAGPVALTLVIDPTAPDAAARAALWRAAGQEVALLADALPARGQGSDFEVAMESLATAFPQALAVVESAGRPLPTDRAGSSALISALAARGFGLVTRGGGLNALDQTARRAGLPAAAIFRALDAEDEAAPVIGRYLDRIAFTAQQDGSVIVIGRLRPETVAAVQDWAAGSSRAAALVLAPVSALVQAAPRPAP